MACSVLLGNDVEAWREGCGMLHALPWFTRGVKENCERCEQMEYVDVAALVRLT